MLADYVLKKPSKADQAALDDVFNKCSAAVTMIVSGRITDAQNEFNKKHEANMSISIDHRHAIND